MILLWFTAGVVPAVLLGVYLPWSAWVLPVGLGSLAAGFLFKGLKKWPPLRRFLFGAGAILVWLAVYSALFHAPAQDLEHRTIQMEAVVCLLYTSNSLLTAWAASASTPAATETRRFWTW